MFNMTEEFLTERKGIHTAREIFQQPSVWRIIFADYAEKRERFQKFIDTILEKHQRVKVIFTGAGTSAFTGDMVVPGLTSQGHENFDFVAIPTTDIVAAPTHYLRKHEPTILVSFGRSGNSPESVAAMELGQKIVDNFYQVVITCNKNGKMAKVIDEDPNSFLFQLPDEAHDQGFAMTSSFTGMALAAYLLFSKNQISEELEQQLVETGKQFLDTVTDTIDQLLPFEFNRIVYLGSGLLGQLSHEAALKMLELTAGITVAVHESSMGFRHGPKSILNDQTLVVLFVSGDAYTRQYDLDILREIKGDSPGVKIVVLAPTEDEEISNLSDWFVPVGSASANWDEDFYLALVYIMFAQILALKKSLRLGITPDNPSPDGRVNRVVKGVTIYPWDE